MSCLPSWSHTWSIGERSGDKDGQGNTLILCWARNAMLTRATLGRALSCWNVIPAFAWMNGNTCGGRISSVHWGLQQLPQELYVCSQQSRPKSSHYRPRKGQNVTQTSAYLSPTLRSTLITCPSALQRKRDSSVNNTLPLSNSPP